MPDAEWNRKESGVPARFARSATCFRNAVFRYYGALIPPRSKQNERLPFFAPVQQTASLVPPPVPHPPPRCSEPNILPTRRPRRAQEKRRCRNLPEQLPRRG